MSKVLKSQMAFAKRECLEKVVEKSENRNDFSVSTDDLEKDVKSTEIPNGFCEA